MATKANPKNHEGRYEQTSSCPTDAREAADHAPPRVRGERGVGLLIQGITRGPVRLDVAELDTTEQIGRDESAGHLVAGGFIQLSESGRDRANWHEVNGQGPVKRTPGFGWGDRLSFADPGQAAAVPCPGPRC